VKVHNVTAVLDEMPREMEVLRSARSS